MARNYYNNDPREIRAKFDSVCPETGKAIKKGDLCVYFPSNRKAYHTDSQAAATWRGQQFSDSWGLGDANW